LRHVQLSYASYGYLRNVAPLSHFCVSSATWWGNSALVITHHGAWNPIDFRKMGSFTCLKVTVTEHGTSVYRPFRKAIYSGLGRRRTWTDKKHLLVVLSSGHWSRLSIQYASLTQVRCSWFHDRPSAQQNAWNL
jgi:hypothetical protein